MESRKIFLVLVLARGPQFPGGADAQRLGRSRGGLSTKIRAATDMLDPEFLEEIGDGRVTLYPYVSPQGELRDYGMQVLGLA
jgi:hypothetical protein